MSLKLIIIDYDATKGLFFIAAPKWANGIVRDIPSRRFSPRSGLWSAPGTRLNCKFMEQNLGDASWSRLALDKILQVKSAIGNMVAPALPFPNFYKFKTEPFKTQRTGVERAFGRSSFMFFKDMGTGKTKTFIDLACASRMFPLIETVLLICPIAVRKNWVRELAIHSPLPTDVLLLNSDNRKEFDAWLNKKHDFKWFIIGVESLGISKKADDMMLDFMRKYPKTMMCVDEIHTIKNHAAVRSKRAQTAARYAPYRIGMTGTPIGKGVMDLFGMFEYLDPDILGTGDFYSFRNRYAVMGGFENKMITGYQNMDELMEIINPFVYQVRKEEALPDLPPKMYTKRYIALTAEQTKHYKTMAKDRIIFNEDGRQKIVANVLEKVLRLQQIAGGHAPWSTLDPFDDKIKVVVEPIGDVNPKVRDVVEFCKSIDGSVIVWCAFRPEIEAVAAALRAEFGDDNVVEVHGGISEDQRDVNVNELFQKKKATKMVANAATGGTGLTMTAAEYEYFYSNTHHMIARLQAEDRAHRKGQEKSVLIVDAITQIQSKDGSMVDTVDGLICLSNDEKVDLSEYVRGEIDKLAARGESDLSSIFGI